MPLGFKDQADAKSFGDGIRNQLSKAGLKNTQIVVRGSAATGKKYNPDTGRYDGKPFNEGRRSDLDIALADPKLHAKASKRFNLN